jgi:dTDP-glucose 4,6-dehydratase
MILVTGAAGFIGSNFVRYWLEKTDDNIVAVDLLAYASSASNLDDLGSDRVIEFVVADIGDSEKMQALLIQHRPRAIVNFAAETHVDRSIKQPAIFVQNNVVSLFSLLETSLEYWRGLAGEERDAFRFLQVSTDEVYGSLAPDESAFTEESQYAPNSPYSASKASGDHLVRAYNRTYGLPTLVTNCSNNYGPWQFPEKLIPLCVSRALELKSLPIYGDGKQIRDWLFVRDHCAAIAAALREGIPGEMYNVGGDCEVENIVLVSMICEILDGKLPRADGKSYAELITFVQDRPGHDRRYAVNSDKLKNNLGWQPATSIADGLRVTIDWYIDNAEWTQRNSGAAYKDWLSSHYGDRP